MVLSNPWFIISALGDPRLWIVVAVVLAVYYFATKRKQKWVKSFVLLVVISMLIAFGLSHGFKEIIQIPRDCVPCPADDCNEYCPTSPTFPSGHTTAAFAAFTGIWLLLGKRKKYLWIFILPILVGLSRVMLGVHTWLDVFGGTILGIIVVYFLYKWDWYCRKRKKSFKRKRK